MSAETHESNRQTPAWVSYDPVARLLQARAMDPPTRLGLLANVDCYEVLQVLGEGSMSIVVLARDSRDGREVAIKLLRPEWTGEPRVVRRFLTEARHMQQLAHPHVLPVLEVSDRPEGPYFVTPYMEKGSLSRGIKPGEPLDEAVVRSAALPIAEALTFAHDKGIIHRDIKPGNILLDAQDRAWLADFGLHRNLVLNESILDVRRVSFEGTAPYLAPEIAAGKAGDFRSDIYSFGAMLYEMLSGELPYAGEKQEEIIQKIVAGPPVPLRQRASQVSAGMVRVVEGAMARELRDRYSTMADLLADLQRLEGGEPPHGPRGRRRGLIMRRHHRWTVAAATALGVVLLVSGLLRHWFAPEQVRLPFPVHLEGEEAESSWWIPGKQSRSGVPGKPYGVQKGDWRQADRAFVLDAYAETELEGDPAIQNLESTQYVWLDSMLDLKGRGEVGIELDLSLTGKYGGALVVLSDGSSPEPDQKYRPLKLLELQSQSDDMQAAQRGVFRIELSESSMLATVFQDDRPNGPFELVDLTPAGGFTPWKLRLLASAAGQRGRNPGHARVSVNRITIDTLAADSRPLVGFVKDATTRRGLPGVRIVTNQNAEARINDKGMYLLDTDSANVFTVEASKSGYEQVGGKLQVATAIGKQRRENIYLRRISLRYGDALGDSCLPLSVSGEIRTFAVRNLRFLVGIYNDYEGHLYCLSHADPDLRDFFVSPGVEADVSALAYRGGALYSAAVHRSNIPADRKPQGFIGRIDADGPSADVAWLESVQPSALTFDGRRAWYINTDLAAGRFGIHLVEFDTNGAGELDLDSGHEVGHADMDVPPEGNAACGIAFARSTGGGKRLWVSYVFIDRSFETLRGVVYELDPDKLLEKGRLDPKDPEVVIRQFDGSWHQLSYDTETGTLWGLDRKTERICQINIEE